MRRMEGIRKEWAWTVTNSAGAGVSARTFDRDRDKYSTEGSAGPELGWCPLWCKDTAARCVVVVTPQFDGRPHPLFAPFSVMHNGIEGYITRYDNSGVANALSESALRGAPVFYDEEPSWLMPPGTISRQQIDEMLAKGIPALTPSLGTTSLKIDDESIYKECDLMKKRFLGKDCWPKRVRDKQTWLHNDMKDVSYLGVHTLFDEITTQGGMR